MIVYGGGKSGRIHRNVQTPVDPKEPELTKVCKCCERELPVSEFWTVKTKSGRRPKPMCRACEKARKNELRAGLAKPIYRTDKKPITVTDMVTGNETDYPSINSAANDIGCAPDTIKRRINGRTGSLIDGRYAVRRKDAE